MECDSLKDGALDFPDDVLAALDYVVVSVHGSFSLPEAEMTRRLIRAIENPYVTMLGHLTGRLLLERESYALDVPAVLDAAAATGTIIELNANTWRLDMDWRWWHLAQEKGVKCAINPDAHRTDGLQDLWFGVAQARKGWLTRADVVNCLPLGQVEAALAAQAREDGPMKRGQNLALASQTQVYTNASFAGFRSLFNMATLPTDLTVYVSPKPTLGQRLGVEFLGTLWLVLGGCGSAVLAAKFSTVGIGLVGVSFAFGLTVLTMAFAFGHISGGHFNPAVSVGLFLGGRFKGQLLPAYIIAQVLGALAGAGLLYVIATGNPAYHLATDGLATNGFGDASPGGYNLTAALVTEVVMTAVFLFIILGATDARAAKGFGPLAIGLGLTLIHLVSIPVTNTSVNPARSTGPAIFVGGVALQQLWLFWVAPDCRRGAGGGFLQIPHRQHGSGGARGGSAIDLAGHGDHRRGDFQPASERGIIRMPPGPTGSLSARTRTASAGTRGWCSPGWRTPVRARRSRRVCRQAPASARR